MGSKSVGVGGSAAISEGRGTVTTTAALIIPANPSRRAVHITKHGKKEIYLGATSGVTVATGFQFGGKKGDTIRIDTSAEIFAVVDKGSEDISFLELED